MIKWFSNNYKPLPPMYVDLWLYVAIAFFGAILASLITDEAKEFISRGTLFFSRMACSAIIASCVQAKSFRSTAFADHKAAKQNINSPNPIP